MKKIDKIKAIKFQPTFQTPRGDVYGYVEYDIKKIRRTGEDEMKALLFEKTLQLYPCSIIDDKVIYEDFGRTAQYFITLPLSPWLRVSPVSEGE